MTKVRRRSPGEQGMGTRRCDRREFLLRPDCFVNHILSYLLGYQQMRHGFRLHFFVAMSNHYHAGISDRGQLIYHSATSPLMRDFNSLSARALNVHRKRRGAFWSGGGQTFNFVLSPGVDDMLDRYVYALTNPVVAGLVAKRRQWPGLLLDPGPSGRRVMRIPRPKLFFRDSMPDEVELVLEAPACAASPGDFMQEVYRRANIHEERIRAQMEAEGKQFLGVKGVRRQSPFSQPASYEPHRGIRPQVAIKDKWQRIEHLQKNAHFQQHYEECRDALRAGDQDVVFPLGTYKLVAYYGARCQGPDPPQ